MGEVNKDDIVYYARVLPTVDIYEIIELKVRTVTNTYFVGIDKQTKHAYLFGFTNLDRTVFKNRNNALVTVKEAEKHRKKVSSETYYEED